MSLTTIASLLFASLAWSSEAGETGVRRSTRNGLIEIRPNGPIQRQGVPGDDPEVDNALAEDQDRPRCTISEGTSPPYVGGAEAYQFFLRTYRNVTGASECALLCASNVECKTFYHIKNTSHSHYKECTLTKWDGGTAQFAADDCCDSGFPCSAKDIMAPLQNEINRLNGALKNRQESFAKKDTDMANEIKLEQKRLDTRQHIMAAKDAQLAADMESQQHLTTENKRLQGAVDIRQQIIAQKDMEMAQAKKNIDAIARDNTRLEHALDIRQHIMVDKDALMVEEKKKNEALMSELKALAKTIETQQQVLAKKDKDHAKEKQEEQLLMNENERLQRALETRQHIIAGKDVDIAAKKNEGHLLAKEQERLNGAIKIRQQIMVAKDEEFAKEKRTTASLQSQVKDLAQQLALSESGREALTAEVSQVRYRLAWASVVTVVLLVGLVASLAMDRRKDLQKPSKPLVRGNNAQLATDSISNTAG